MNRQLFRTLSESRIALWVAATLRPLGDTPIDALRTMPDREGGVCLLERGEVVSAVKMLCAAGMNVRRIGKDHILSRMRPSEISLIELAWNTHFEESI